MSDSEPPSTRPLTFIGLLNQDIDWQAADSAQPKYAQSRRTLVRSAFAAIEGAVFHLKQLLLEIHTSRLIALSAGELSVLREECYDLDTNGTVRVSGARLPFLANLRFTISMIQKAGHSKLAIDYGGKGWQALQASVKVRDRLMHPKDPEAFDVTDEEIKVLQVAVRWYRDTVTGVLGDMTSYMETVRSSTSKRARTPEA